MRLLACTVTRRPPDVCRPSVEFVLRTCNECDFLIVINGADARQYTPQKFNNNTRLSTMHIPVNVGHPGGINFALGVAMSLGYEYFLLLDDDITFITEDWYAKCLQLMAFDPQIGCIGAKVLNPDMQTVQWGYTRITPQGWDFNMGQPREKAIVNRILRGCMVQCCFLFCRMEAIRKVGYFDLLFSPTQYEDADYSFRMWVNGYSCVYDGRIEIVHHFKVYKDNDDPMRRLHSDAHAYAIDRKYNGVLQFGMGLEQHIDKIGREIVLPQSAPAPPLQSAPPPGSQKV